MLLRQFHEFLRDAPQSAASDHIRKRLEASQRFVFSESAAAACRQLAQNPDRLREAKAQIFAPFPDCWFEFQPSDTPDGVRVSEGIFWAGDDDENLRKGGLIFVGWPHKSEFPVLLPTRIDLDTDDIMAVPGKALEILGAAQSTVMRGQLTPAEARAAAPELLLVMLAAWALLASQGMTYSFTPDMSKLNRSRGKRGLYPLLAYSEIRLNLDVERAIRAKSIVGTGHMPLHPVRAHLRLLSTGRVIIIRAHMRGNPEYGIVSHAYSVVTSEDDAALS